MLQRWSAWRWRRAARRGSHEIILTASRHPALTRPAFFRHLREVHWPLVSGFPDVLREIRRYAQNHSVLPEEDGGVPTPWRRAAERDSVIEVWFDGMEGLQRMDADPDYVAQVRPDEAFFNDLPNNILLAATEQTFHETSGEGRVKRFDFLYRKAGCDEQTFEEGCRDACRALALDPLFQALSDRQSLHLPFAPEAPAQVDAVLATAASGLDAISRLAAPRFVEGFAALVDDTRSFSVLATAFPIHPAA